MSVAHGSCARCPVGMWGGNIPQLPSPEDPAAHSAAQFGHRLPLAVVAPCKASSAASGLLISMRPLESYYHGVRKELEIRPQCSFLALGLFFKY